MKNKKYLVGILLFIIIAILCIILQLRKNNPISNTFSVTTITFDEGNVLVEGDGVNKKGKEILISSSGIYTLSGTSNDSNIVVDAKGQEVTLIFDSLNLTSKTTAPIYIKKAETVTITLADDTENSLADNESYQYTDNDEINGALHSKADLIINGNGSLSIKASQNNGITGKDTVKISDTTLYINASNNGIKAKDSLMVENSKIDIKAGGNGIKAYNETDSNSGTMEIINSNIEIISAEDGMEAITSLSIENGTYHITSGDGSNNNSTKNDWGFWGNSSREQEETTSAKGIKADGTITIKSGSFNIDSSDDSVHSNNNIEIQNGTFDISSGDDGIHADNILTIEDGEINIKKSYEGLEASTIYLNGGKTTIKSSDDGINAGGGNDSSSMSRPGANQFSNNNYKIIITGGYYMVDSDGDGIDSNGIIEMSDGTLIIEGPTDNGNGAIDYDGSFNLTGGILIAIGSSGMMQVPSNTSTQNSIVLSFSSQSETSGIQITKNDGTEIITYIPTKRYSSLIFSSPTLNQNEQYSIYLNGTTSENQKGLIENANFQNGTLLTTLTITNRVTTYGNSMNNGFRNIPNNGMPGGDMEGFKPSRR